MSERNATEFLNLRLPLYAYAAPLWQGRSVLEIGCGDGGSADYLVGAGAERVISVDIDAARIERARSRHARPHVEFRAVAEWRRLGVFPERFDIVLVPDGQALLALPEVISEIHELLTDGGFLIMAVPAADRKSRSSKDGIGYYDLADPLAAEFPSVRMLGQTPFLGFGLVEFDGSADALRVDVSLLHGGAEPPSHYVAISGASPPPSLGYALVQVPFRPFEGPALGSSTGQAPALEITATGSDTRAELAERRLDDAERRTRARLDEAEQRSTELRRKLDEALGQSESAVRVARAQGEEIEELRGRLRRVAEDRASTDADMVKMRRALAQADESVLTLTRRTAEEMAVVAEKMAAGLSLGAEGRSGAEGEARVRQAEEAAARDRAEVVILTQRIRAADEQLHILKQKGSGVAERDDRIARLEGDKQDLVWRAAELEEKLRRAEADLVARRSLPDETAATRDARNRAIEEFHKAAAAHAHELQQLQSSVAEQAALVAELEDAVKAAEARANAADKETTTLRRNAKELEDADRARRGRLAELEGKLLRLERDRAAAQLEPPPPPPLPPPAPPPALPPIGATSLGGMLSMAQLADRLAAAEQRALAAEQRAAGAEERSAAHASQVSAGSNGHPAAGLSPTELEAAIAEIEGRLRDEMRALAVIEETLNRSRAEAARAGYEGEAGARADWERALAAKDSQLVEGRLELARLRRDSEARQSQLEREIGDLRSRLSPAGAVGLPDEQSQSAQVILMHSTLANIRRRSARLRDELEGFRRRLDTLPPGALSSMLEEIGEDLAEFAK